MAPVFGFLALTALAALVCSPSATVLLASSAFGLLAAVPLLVIIRLVRLGAAVVPRPPVVIGYGSALEFWRKTWLAGNGDAGDLLGDPFPDDLLLAGAESPELLAGYPKLQPVANGAAGARRVSELVGLSEPVGLIVESAACRNETEKVQVLRVVPERLARPYGAGGGQHICVRSGACLSADGRPAWFCRPARFGV